MVDPSQHVSRRNRRGRTLIITACAISALSMGWIGFLAATPYGGAANPFEAARTCAFLDRFAVTPDRLRFSPGKKDDIGKTDDMALLAHACREAQYALSGEFFRQPPHAWLEKWLAGLNLRQPVDQTLSQAYLAEVQYLYRLSLEAVERGHDVRPHHILAYARSRRLVNAGREILGLEPVPPAAACGIEVGIVERGPTFPGPLEISSDLVRCGPDSDAVAI